MDKAENKGEPSTESTSEPIPDSADGSTTTTATAATTDTKAGEAGTAGRAPKGGARAKSKNDAEAESKPKGKGADTVHSVRGAVATAVWTLAVIAALVLAAGALVIALDFNASNGVVKFLSETADRINVLGTLKKFEPSGRGAEARHDALVKTVLVSWGICAIAYLVVGKLLDRLIRP
jgi:hypothetical protein